MKMLPGTPVCPPPGKRGKKRHPKAIPAGQEHDFGPGVAKGQPSWLSGGDNGRRTCRRCGVEEFPPGAFVMADHAGFGSDGADLLKGKDVQGMWTYVDAKGRQFTSGKKLGCPTFFLDEMGAIRENREMVREVDDRVDYTDDRVDDVEERVESVEERLARLEAENATLKARLDAGFDVTAMVEWLGEMVALHAAQRLATVEVQVEGRQTVALPAPVANMILNVGKVTECEPAPIRREGGSKMDLVDKTK